MRHCTARWRNRKALAAIDDGDPRLTHAQVLALSVAQQTDVVLSVGGSMACPATNAMSSKSEFVIVPVRFELETRCWPTVGGKGARQIMGGNGVGWMAVGSQKPPIPAAQASVAPMAWGAVGTSAAMGAGIFVALVASWSQSCRAHLMSLLRRSLLAE